MQSGAVIRVRDGFPKEISVRCDTAEDLSRFQTGQSVLVNTQQGLMHLFISHAQRLNEAVVICNASILDRQ